jgi:uncharacterized repeat protein (TIGR01451 family)
MIPNFSLVATNLAQSKMRLASLVLALACLLPLLLAGCNSSTSGNVGPTGAPALMATVITQGNFSSGQQNATYTIQVTNSGTGATSGTVTLVDPLTGFTVTAISGTNWTCMLATTTCTYGNSVAAGQAFPPITVTGNVTSANGTPVSIALSVSGGGTSAPANSTPTVTVAAPALSITKTHTGNFTQNQQGATYTVTVANGASAGATNAKVTMTETVPSGETLVSMSGTGWTCPGAGGANTCDRSDTLATGASYPVLTVTVNVSSTATSPQVNQVSVSGGGMTASASTSDSTTINTPTIATISVSPSSPSIGMGGSQQFTATATDSGGNVINGVTFTWASSATNVATINSSGLASGISQGTTQITASANGVTSSQDTLTVTSSIACGSGGSESLLSGSYALLLKGFDSAGNPALIGGVLTFNGTDNNGLITAGAIDMNLNSGVQLDLAVTSGSYGVGSDQRGCMVIITSAGTQNYRFALGNISSGVASTGHVIGFDQGGPYVAGILREQTTSAFSTSQVTGNYAFGVSSPQNIAQASNGVSGGKTAAVGILNLSSGSIIGGEVDANSNGSLDGNAANTTWPATPISISSGGSYTISSTSGRGTIQFTVTGDPNMINAVIYVVSATDVLYLSSDLQTNPNGNAIFAGELLQQSGAPFSANPLSGSYVGYNSGLGPGTGRSEINLLGPLTSGNNTFSFTILRNDGGTFGSGTASGTYSVSSTGRVIVSGTGGHDPVLYLASSSQAFFLRSNPGVDSGFFESQSGSPFSTSSASGTYALGAIDPENLNGADTSGVVTFTPATSSLSDTYDGNQSGGSPGLDHMDSLTYSIDSTGLGMSPSGCTISASSTTCRELFYIISPTKAAFIDINPNSTTPKVYLLDQ